MLAGQYRQQIPVESKSETMSIPNDLLPRWVFGCGDDAAGILGVRRVCASQAPFLQEAFTPPLALTLFIYQSLR